MRVKKSSKLIAALSLVMAASAGGFAGHASAETINFKFPLSGDKETPSNVSKGVGQGSGVYDSITHLFKYKIKFRHLTGPAQAAHFHGPAQEGKAAGVEVPIQQAAPLHSPISGVATLTGVQAQELLDGLWYFNIHTKAYPAGEIRGQVLKVSAIGKVDQNATGTGGALPDR